MSIWLLLLRYRRVIAGVAILAALALALHSYGHSRFLAGVAQEHEKSQHELDRINAVATATAAAALAKETAAQKNNAEVIRHANEQLVSIAGERNTLSDSLRRARQSSAGRCYVPESADQPGAVAAASDTENGRIDAAVAAALTEARSNNVRHVALIDQITPQVSQ